MRNVIGITGGIASGKSTVSSILKEKGYNVIDCDKIAHDIQKYPHPCYFDIINNFDVLEDNIISRKKLGNIVFNNQDELKKLNDIMHPYIYDEVKLLIKDELTFIDCPLLFETNFIDLCDKSIVVYCNKDIQISRLTKRNNISIEEAINKINLQISLEDKKNKANYVIMNNTTINDLKEIINKLIKEI